MTNTLTEKKMFTSNPAELKNMRDFVRHTTEHLALPASTIEDMVVAVNEACMNIMQHGYADTITGNIQLEITTGNDEVIFRIIDNAPVINPASLISRPLDEIRPGGLGIHFIRSVMDVVEYKPGDHNIGNILELRKKTVLQGVL